MALLCSTLSMTGYGVIDTKDKAKIDKSVLKKLK